ncbi:UDP-glucose pyrophosphorylase [Globicatella sulfidifaciens DSM 15739]|uniref:UTP--glucose-1-phosphate uridylyltransferase n=1 Tax=Globicatella sulfidifaciens DSM 15739 TaxID=1121925 RepID=A0A1T4JVL0_9LACT|nr:UDP-glucose pyrophosphorylase [Globicatella sulfidifaciens DSM 15739]
MSDETVFSVKTFVEKPSKAEQPSNLVIAGRYILTPDIFEVLESLKPGVDEEIQLTDAINQLSQTNKVLAKVIEGERFDVGDKLGYLEYSLQYGLRHPETSQDLKKYLIELVKQL